MRLLAAAASSLLLVACADETGTVRVAPQLSPCMTWGPDACLLVNDIHELDVPPVNHYGGIPGYEHHWGEIAEVDYHVEDGAGGPDEPSFRWIADEVRVIGHAAAGDTFRSRFVADSERWFRRSGPNLVEALWTPIRCEPELCDEAVDPIGIELDVVMAHDGAGGVALVSVTQVP
jgi:hypothetical protein